MINIMFCPTKQPNMRKETVFLIISKWTIHRPVIYVVLAQSCFWCAEEELQGAEKQAGDNANHVSKFKQSVFAPRS